LFGVCLGFDSFYSLDSVVCVFCVQYLFVFGYGCGGVVCVEGGVMSCSLMIVEAVRQISGVRGIHLVLSMWDIAFVAWMSSLFRSLLKDQRMISLSVAVEAYVLGASSEVMWVSVFRLRVSGGRCS